MDASAGIRMMAIILLKGCTVACWFMRCRPKLDNVLDGCVGSPTSLYSIVIALYALLHFISDVSLYLWRIMSLFELPWNTIQDGITFDAGHNARSAGLMSHSSSMGVADTPGKLKHGSDAQFLSSSVLAI